MDETNKALIVFLKEFKQEFVLEAYEMFKSELETFVDPKEFYSVKEAAKKMGLSENGIRNRIRDGKIKRAYDGITPLIPTSEVERMIKFLKKQVA